MSATKNDAESLEVEISKEQEEKLRTELKLLQSASESALQNLHLPKLNQLLGQAISLQEINTFEHLQPQLDDTVQKITRQQQQLRDRLGSASTLSVSGNHREAYRQAQEYLKRGVITIVDKAGIFGEAGKEVDSFHFYQDARHRFIQSLQDLAQQRLSLVEGQKRTNPAIALQTLEDASQRLQDDILSKEDRDELYSTFQVVEEQITEVKERLPHFLKAQKLILSAQEERKSPKQQLKLLYEARYIYPDYPQIYDYIDSQYRLVETSYRSHLKDLNNTLRYFQDRAKANGYSIKNDEIEHIDKLLSKEIHEWLDFFSHLYSLDTRYVSIVHEINREFYQIQGELAKVKYKKSEVTERVQDVEKSFNHYQDQKVPELLAQAKFKLIYLTRDYNNNPDVQRYKILIEQAQEQIWIKQAKMALQAQPPDFEEAITKLRLIPKIESSTEGLSLLIEAIRGYIAKRLAEAKEAVARFNFREAQSILSQLQKQFTDWLKGASITFSITGEVESLIQESIDYREAQRDLGEANDIVQRNDTKEDVNVDELLQKALALPYHSAVATTLKRDAELLRSYKFLYIADYDTYKQRLLAMLLKNPEDEEIISRYEKIKDYENKERWASRRLKWANIWFAISVLTALLFLCLAFYSIYILVSQNNDLAILSPLLAALPIFATKLVYDRFSELYTDPNSNKANEQDQLPDNLNE